MIVVHIIVAVLAIFTFICMVGEDCTRRKEIRAICYMIEEFNLAYQNTKEYINEQINFSETSLGNDEGKFKISLSNEGGVYYEVSDTKEMRKYLDNMGEMILREEETLIEKYGEMNYHDSYKVFKEGLEKVRHAMKKYGE